MALYPADQLSEIIRGWVYDTLAEQDREEFEREYNQYLDETYVELSEDEAYIKFMEQEEAAFLRSLEDPSYV